MKKELIIICATILSAFLLISSVKAVDEVFDNEFLVYCYNTAMGGISCPADFITSGQTCSSFCNLTSDCHGNICPPKEFVLTNPTNAKTTIQIGLVPPLTYNFSVPSTFTAFYNCFNPQGNVITSGTIDMRPFWVDISTEGGNPCTCRGVKVDDVTQCSWNGGAVGVDYCPQIAVVMNSNMSFISCGFTWFGNGTYDYWVKVKGFDVIYKEQTIPNENLKAIAEGSKTIVSLNVQIWQIIFYLFEIVILILALFGLPVFVILMIKWAIKNVGGK